MVFDYGLHIREDELTGACDKQEMHKMLAEKSEGRDHVSCL